MKREREETYLELELVFSVGTRVACWGEAKAYTDVDHLPKRASVWRRMGGRREGNNTVKEEVGADERRGEGHTRTRVEPC